MPTYLFDARTAVNHFPGIGRYTSNLARALVPLLADDEKLILLHDPRQPSQWPLPAPTAHLQRISAPFSPFGLAQQWQIPRLIRPLHAHLYHSPYYLMPYRTGLPTLLTIYDFIPERYPQYTSWRARLLYRFFHQLALRSAQQVITISAATRADLLAHYRYPAGRVTPVPLAADPQFQPQTATQQAAVRQRYNLPAQFVLYLGINKPHKNLVRLITAWASIYHNLPQPVPLVIAGAWDERYVEPRTMAAHFNLLGEGVHFLGPVDEADLPALYSAATLFVFPSLYEGFGLPVIEAMACGTAVLCADGSSLPEIAGEAALLFDATAEGEMATALQRLLTDAPLRQGLEVRSLAQARKFSWHYTAEATLALYRQMVGASL